MSARPYSIDGQFGRGLFTKITLMKIDICFNQLLERVFLATNVSYFIFSGLLYKQIDGVAMGS